MKISEAFDLYKNNYLLPKHYSKRLIETHDYIKRDLILKIGDKKLKNLTLKDISDWSRTIESWQDQNGIERRKATNTMRSYLTRVRAVIKYMCLLGEKCVDYHLVPVPKCEQVKVNFISPEEISMMIDASYSIRNAFVVSLLYSSGIRLSEMIQLDRDSIKNRTFTVVGKGNKIRVCFIDQRTEDLMNQYLDSRTDSSEALIISNIYKERISRTNVQLLIKNTARRAGINKKVTPHTMRHSFATNFAQNNGNMRYLCRLLGHSSMTTTMVYTHVTDNDLKLQYERFHSV